jgi:hypothetical protein
MGIVRFKKTGGVWIIGKQSRKVFTKYHTPFIFIVEQGMALPEIQRTIQMAGLESSVATRHDSNQKR